MLNFNDLLAALLPYEGRSNHGFRTTLSTLIVIIISQAYQVPLLALSIIIVFFVTQTNVVITKLTGFLFAIGSSLAVVLSLLIIKVTWDEAFVRLLVSFFALFICVFLMRASTFGVVFFIVAIVIIYSQSLVDITPNSDLLTRGLLWLWVAVNYPVALTVLVNSLFLPVAPENQLVNKIHSIIDYMIIQLNDNSYSARINDSASIAGRDVQAMYRLLRYVVMRDTLSDSERQYYMNIISTLSELRMATCQLPSIFDSEALKEDSRTLKDMLIKVSHSLDTSCLYMQDNNFSVKSKNPVFELMWSLLDSYLSRSPENLVTNKKDRRHNSSSLFLGSINNSTYISYSLKVLLCASVSYLFYVITDWPGIHTIMLSCLIVAQPGLGGTQRKILLRLFGATIGSLLALFFIIIVTPNIDSIFGLLLFSLPVIMLSSWISAGPESISYAGIQIVFTFSLAVLQPFGPVTELTEVRDRIVGIVLGIIISGVIHALIKPEREGFIFIKEMTSILNDIGQWLNDNEAHKTYRTQLFRKLSECDDLAAKISLEPSWSYSEGTNDSIHQHVNAILLSVKNFSNATDSFLFKINELSQNESSPDVVELINILMGLFKNNLEVIVMVLNGNKTSMDSFTFSMDFSGIPTPLQESAEELMLSQKALLHKLIH